MSEVLSQSEIDKLLDEMSSGALDVEDFAGERIKKSEIVNYDFRRPNRISKSQVRTFQSIHENFAETFGYYLVSRLQTVVSISVTSVDQLFYSEYILSVSNPSCLYVFDIVGTDGAGILEISPQLALVLVERLLGGSGEVQPKPRAITTIEQSVIKNVIEQALHYLENAWRSIAELSFKYQRLELEADFVQVAPSSEIVIVVSFDVNIGLHTYLMNLCFPTFALEEVLTKLSRQQVTAGPIKMTPEKMRENVETLKRHMSKTFLPVVAELGRSSITAKELLELKAGDIIKLKNKITDEITIYIAGRRKFAGRPGMVDGKKAVKILRPLREEDLIEDDLFYKEES
ncbi:MAG: flagellar motor switch protein FliM [Ignavibacteria bacterium]|nr:flagellar motor switch protein FliM [Ignavibacteria bacterium]